MALAMMLRSTCRNAAVPSLMLRNAARISSFAVRPALQKSLLVTPVQLLKQTTPALRPIVQNQIIRHSHSHVTLWKVEKLVALAILFGCIPLMTLLPGKAMEAVFAAVAVAHTHWGWESIVCDYVRAVVFGRFIAKAAIIATYMFSAGLLAGLLNFIYNDIGIVATVKKIWAIEGAK
uniref:Succinate dehydrogenase [ubiquinone] cytochrome b small subunit n=1 Tax=Culicoides sonorensis TaxID=179676 RepID=A0A336LV43_CULSO